MDLCIFQSYFFVHIVDCAWKHNDNTTDAYSMSVRVRVRLHYDQGCIQLIQMARLSDHHLYNSHSNKNVCERRVRVCPSSIILNVFILRACAYHAMLHHRTSATNNTRTTHIRRSLRCTTNQLYTNEYDGKNGKMHKCTG